MSVEADWKDAAHRAEMRWMSMEDATIELPARLVAKHSRCHEEWKKLALDMGEALTELRAEPSLDFGDCRAECCEHPGCLKTRRFDALLARLDGLAAGKGYIGSGGRVVPDLMLEEQRAGKETAE